MTPNPRFLFAFSCCSALALGCSASSSSPFPEAGGTTGVAGSSVGSAGSGNTGSSFGGQPGLPGLAGAPATSLGGSPPVGMAGSPSGLAGSGVGIAGAPSTGGAGAPSTAGTPPASPAGFFVAGYLTSAPWMGYVFTFSDALASGTAVSPVCSTTGCLPAWGTQACAKGTVAKDVNSASFLGLAFHVIDPMPGGMTGTWPVAGTGIMVSVYNPPAGARMQLQELSATSNDQRYCAPLPAGGTGVIPFTSFKTYCWGDIAHPSKVLAAGTKIHELAITVPGNAMTAVPADFCLVNIAPQP